MSVYEQISKVVSLTLVGLVLYFVLEFPEQVAVFTLFGSPLGLDTSWQWLMVMILTALAMSGTDNVIRSQLSFSDWQLGYWATFWMLPGLLVLLATQTLILAPTPIGWAIGLVGYGVLLWTTILSQFHQAVSTNIIPFRWAYWWQQFIGYGLALSLFTFIYQARVRSAISATAILLVSGAIALALLRQNRENISITWLFASVIGLCLGQVTWALNHWQVSTMGAGLFLFLIFYILVGIAQQPLHKLSRRTIGEFGLMTMVTLAIIYIL